MKILNDDIGELRTERLLLRPLRVADADALLALFDNWNVIRFLSSPPWPYRRADAEWYVRSAVEHAPGFDEDVRAIIHDHMFLGVIGVRMRPANELQRGPGPNVGYWLGEPFWGHGFMSEAASAFVRALFDTSDAGAVYSGAFAENAASLRLQDKIGFQRDGTSMLFSTPRGADYPHVNTVLTREGFALARSGLG